MRKVRNTADAPEGSHSKKVSLYKSKESLSVCVCVCLSVCVCVPQISADQDQTDLRFSTWLLRGLRVCNVRSVWNTMITHLKKQVDLYLQRRELDWDFAGGLVPFCVSKLTVVD